jgi:hypothetical protein
LSPQEHRRTDDLFWSRWANAARVRAHKVLLQLGKLVSRRGSVYVMAEAAVKAVGREAALLHSCHDLRSTGVEKGIRFRSQRHCGAACDSYHVVNRERVCVRKGDHFAWNANF